jgi:hypothetical protein
MAKAARALAPRDEEAAAKPKPFTIIPATPLLSAAPMPQLAPAAPSYEIVAAGPARESGNEASVPSAKMNPSISPLGESVNCRIRPLKAGS